MANTKLSNIYGLDKMIKNVPSKIDKYTKEVHEEVDSIKTKSLYYSEMSVIGMLTCIVLLVIGAGVTFVPDLLFQYLSIVSIDTSNIGIKVVGVFLILASVHGIGRMIFATKVASTTKNVDKIGDGFKTQFENTALPQIAGNQLFNKIENFEDDELSESSTLDNKLFNSISSMHSQDQLFSKLVLVSRIVLPIILFVCALLTIIKGTNLGLTRVVFAFIIMFIFNSRLCLLLEYKVGALIRAIMCVPSVIYGIVVFTSIKEEAQGLSFLPFTVLMKIPEAAINYVGTAAIVCLFQVIILILSVSFKDYYSEKERWRDGVLIKPKGEEKHKKWYIIYGIVLYVILMSAYTIALLIEKEDIQYNNSIGIAILVGAIFGVIWRIISPIWPEAIGKTIRKFWGVKYTVVIELFFVVLVLSVFLLNGFVFSIYSFVLLVSIILFSWIAFAVMVHFWG